MKIARLASVGLAGLLFAVPADASEHVYQPGSACFFYSGTESGDASFSRSGGNGILHNIGASFAKAECPVTYDLDASGGTYVLWSISGSGVTSEWDITKCNLFSQLRNSAFAYPTSKNTLMTDTSGFVQLAGGLGGSGTMSSGFGAEIICSVPAGEGLYGYLTIAN